MKSVTDPHNGGMNTIFDRFPQWRNEHNHCCMLQIGTKIYCNKNLRNKNLLIFKNQH